jgi:hypothetical protein
MTVLGAVLYFGFFGFSALWLYLTAGRDLTPEPGTVADRLNHDQRPERSNSVSASAAALGSRSCCASHSSEK